MDLEHPTYNAEPREESPGVFAQKWGGHITKGLKLYLGVDLTAKEQEAVARLVGAFLRWEKTL